MEEAHPDAVGDRSSLPVVGHHLFAAYPFRGWSVGGLLPIVKCFFLKYVYVCAELHAGVQRGATDSSATAETASSFANSRAAKTEAGAREGGVPSW